MPDPCIPGQRASAPPAGPINGASVSQPVPAFTGPWSGVTPLNPSRVASRTTGSVSLDFTGTSTANFAVTIEGRSIDTRHSRLASGRVPVATGGRLTGQPAWHD